MRPLTVTTTLFTMPCTPLGPKSANACVLKNQKTSKKELSPHKRSMIEGMHLASIPTCEISRLTSIPESTIRSTLKLLPSRVKGKSLPRSGRPSKLDRVIKRNIIWYCRQNPKATYATVIRELALDCSHDTIACIVKKEGIKSWLAKKRPILTKEHTKKCYKWCKARKDWGVEEWKRYIWSDECSVELGSEQRREWVFRTPAQKWEKDFIQPYKKGKGVTLMIWGAFSAERRSELIFMLGDLESKRGGVTSAVYLEVLENQLPTLWEPGLVFMQDNTSIHTAKVITNWFKEKGIEVVE